MYSRRWREVPEEEPQITWGHGSLTADPLWDIYPKYHTFRSSDRIWEIGPGFGRVLRTALERNIPFCTWRGIELSPYRAKLLRGLFPQPRIQFFEGDARERVAENADVVLSSGTFEHLYPDFLSALKNLRCGKMMIDFIHAERSTEREDSHDSWVREYTEHELRAIFDSSRLKVDAIEVVNFAPETPRFLVIAKFPAMNLRG